MGMTRFLKPKLMEVYLKKGDIVTAIISASTDLQEILFYKLFFENKTDIKKDDKRTLGQYLHLVERHKLFSDETLVLLNDFKETRDKINHERGYIELLYRDQHEQRRVRKLLKHIKHFIRQARVKTDMERELLYSEQIRKKNPLSSTK